jgi:hypothetical protein
MGVEGGVYLGEGERHHGPIRVKTGSNQVFDFSG